MLESHTTHSSYRSGRNRRNSVTIVSNLNPGIELRLNRNRHREYCAKEGRPFPAAAEIQVRYF